MLCRCLSSTAEKDKRHPKKGKSLKWYRTNKRDSGIGVVSVQDIMDKNKRNKTQILTYVNDKVPAVCESG